MTEALPFEPQNSLPISIENGHVCGDETAYVTADTFFSVRPDGVFAFSKDLSIKSEVGVSWYDKQSYLISIGKLPPAKKIGTTGNVSYSIDENQAPKATFIYEPIIEPAVE